MNNKRVLLFGLLVLLMGTSRLEAVCVSRIFNPVTDICWTCLYPMYISGVMLGGTPGSTCQPSAGLQKGGCVCPVKGEDKPTVGVVSSFWEPARIAEVVQTPFCFPTFGAQIGTNTNTGKVKVLSAAGGEGSFFHVHWMRFPVQDIIGQFYAKKCLEDLSPDVSPTFTEFDPLWNDDAQAAISNPESVLFANPLAQLACVGDAVSTLASCSLDTLFWCMGSAGSAYPLSGNSILGRELAATASLAARTIYRQQRLAVLFDQTISPCGGVYQPIWSKSHYKIQLAMPVRDYTCRAIGETDLKWAQGKTLPWGGANYLYMIWRNRTCCASIR